MLNIIRLNNLINKDTLLLFKKGKTMTRDEINVLYPISDTTDTIQTLVPTETTISAEDKITIKNAFACKDNTLTISLTNTALTNSNVTFIKGVYPNSILGDLTVEIKANSTLLIKIENPSRLEQADGSLLIDFDKNFTGTIYATGKYAGLKKVQ